jgi:monothiol glutaredoxin
MNDNNAIEQKIDQQLKENKVLLYMKGNAAMPRCGFSHKAIQLLNACGAPFATIDILEDEELRNTIKAYKNWPTFPQLYVNGELIGGCDIMQEMYDAGELQTLLAPYVSVE